MRKAAREGRSVMQQIFLLADRRKSFIHYREEGNVVKDMFWEHSDSLSLARCFPSVLLMDAIYKMNRYKMPLLQIVGVTSTNMSFSVGFALLAFEKADNYTWALHMLHEALGDQCENVLCIVTDREEALMNSVRVVFPNARNLVCLWHIEIGLVSNLKNKTTSANWKNLMNTWQRVVKSSTEEEFIAQLDECRQMFNEDAMKYITRTWLGPRKERFVVAWTNSVFHLDNTSTSRVEGMHFLFKNWKKSTVGDMVTEWEAGVNMVEQEIRNVKSLFEKSIFLEPQIYRDEPLFQELKHNVSTEALYLLYGEIKLYGEATNSQTKCGCSIRKTHGLSCTHEIAKYRLNPGFIPLSGVHAHWRTLDMDGPPPTDSQLDYKAIMHAIEDKLRSVSDWERQNIIMMREIYQPQYTSLGEPPVKLKNQGRPKGAQNKNKKLHEESMKRDPSMFERVEGLIVNVDASLSMPKKTSPLRKKKTQVSQEVSQRFNSFTRRYLGYMPTQVHEHVLSVCNVAPDGKCGFRVIALGVGFREEDWPIVRKAIMNEMLLKKDHYLKLMLHEVLVNNCISAADHESGKCKQNKWYDSFMGWGVCKIYGVVLSMMSPAAYACQTFIPSLIQLSARPLKHIWMVHCNKDHYVHAEMKDTCLIPPVARIWGESHLPEVALWRDEIAYRMTLWDEPYEHEL